MIFDSYLYALYNNDLTNYLTTMAENEEREGRKREEREERGERESY